MATWICNRHLKWRQEPRACYTEWSKSEEEKQTLRINTYIWNLERWYWQTYTQGSSRDTDVENRLVDTAGERESRTNREHRHIYIQFSSVAQSCLTLCDPMDCSTPGHPVHHQLPEFNQTHVHWVVMWSSYLILCCPLLLPPSIFPSIRVFSNESALHIRWPKYWSFSFSISPSNEYSGLISFRMDWLDLLAVQGTLKSLLQPQVNFSNQKSTPATVQNLQFYGS